MNEMIHAFGKMCIRFWKLLNFYLRKLQPAKIDILLNFAQWNKMHPIFVLFTYYVHIFGNWLWKRTNWFKSIQNPKVTNLCMRICTSKNTFDVFFFLIKKSTQKVYLQTNAWLWDTFHSWTRWQWSSA